MGLRLVTLQNCCRATPTLVQGSGTRFLLRRTPTTCCFMIIRRLTRPSIYQVEFDPILAKKLLCNKYGKTNTVL